MANEQSGSPLRRWRPFYGAFGAIDDAIEAASGERRAAHQDVRVRILLLLRAATDDDKAEQLCAALDDAMEESLKTLLVAPVLHAALANTGLASAVSGLANHESARIRGLVGDVVRGWRKANVAMATTVKEKLAEKLSGDRIPIQGVSTVIDHGNAPGSVVPTDPLAADEVHKKKRLTPPSKMLPAATAGKEHKKLIVAQSEKIEAKKPVVAQSKKMEAKKPIVAQSTKMEAKKSVDVAQGEKIEATKRKLREGYEEAEKIKRQHVIRKIDDKDASRMFEQSQRRMHRGPARCRISAGVRRSLLPSLQLV